MNNNEIPLFYRSSLEQQIRTYGRKPTITSPLKSDVEINFHIWPLHSDILNNVNYFNEPILACELDEKGNGSLYCYSHNIYSESLCPTILIKDGIVKSFGNSRELTIFLCTVFDLPETCYDFTYKNEKLPEENLTMSQTYCCKLSDYQIPVKRYSYLTRPFFERNLINDNLLIASPKIKTFTDMSLKEMELEESKKIMFISNQATKRISIKEIGIENKEYLKKEKKIKIDPVLTPKPIEDCEIFYRFFAYLGRNLGNYCSYSYLDSQISHFKIITNHLISAKLIGGVIVCSYLDGENNLKREMFRYFPGLTYQSYITGTVLSFACLYPPEDEENWKKYSVCTSTFNNSFDLDKFEPSINITPGMFSCNLEDQLMQPYCVQQIPFRLNCNMILSSFVKYLPSKEGWVDIQEENVNVYTQIKLFTGLQIRTYDYSFNDEYLNKARIMVGTPKIDGKNLGDYNLMDLDTYFSEKSFGLEYGWLKVADGGTKVFNDFAYLCNFTASPTDFQFINQQDPQNSKNDKETILDKLYLLRAQEVAHKMNL